MKKTTLSIEQQQQPRNIQRADIAPGAGYAMVVDGHHKGHFSEESAAKKAATELLARYPMLRVEIYDARTKTRTRVQPKTLDEVTRVTSVRDAVPGSEPASASARVSAASNLA
jgi:hypothetical protein